MIKNRERDRDSNINKNLISKMISQISLKSNCMKDGLSVIFIFILC